MNLALIVLLPLIGAILPALMIRSGRTAATISAATVSILSLALLLTQTTTVLNSETAAASWSWIPKAELDFSLFLDGLGYLFAAMILSIGILVIIYARFYLTRQDATGRFLAYLLLFQGAMLGIVLSNNILLLIVFWELTSLTSFLLIGFKSQYAEGRQGARMALTITGAGGLALLAAMILLGNAADTFQLSEVLARRELIQSSPYYPWILGLVLLGCFTKSAQFPFHFWLPHAMAAPTPVSAYLHSATMVKAGVFLLARLWPVLSGTDVWFYTVGFTGLFTMLLGGVIATFRDDLKSVLAYSTISHLGMLVFLLGLNSPLAVVACMFHVISHATFKATLFMAAGIVDHETGTRDIRQLGGLWSLMPITTTIATIASLSMAGIPPLNGFLSKEMMLEEASHAVMFNLDWFVPVCVTVASIFSMAYSVRLFWFTFFGKKRFDYPSPPHDPVRGLWLPSGILLIAMLWISVQPEGWALVLTRIAASSTLQSVAPQVHVAHWHGFNHALAMSLIAWSVGIALVLAYRTLRTKWDLAIRLDAKRMFDHAINRLDHSTSWITRVLHPGSLQRIIVIILVAVTIQSCLAFFNFTYASGNRRLTPTTPVIAIVWLLVMIACLFVIIKHRERLLALITINVIGLVSALAFIYLSAPDLALTQISVEVVTLILMLLSLYFLPQVAEPESTVFRRVRDGILASVVGVGIASISWLMMTQASETRSEYYLEQSLPGGGGANVVNVILVDFRGFDTYGEMSVIGISALAIHAMLAGMMRGPLLRKLSSWRSTLRKSPDRHPAMMVVITRMMLPLALMVSVFILVRGHQLPGGGFIGALVVSIALIMQYMASGFGWAEKQLRFDYHVLIGAGGLVASATGIGSMVLGLPFLTSGYTHVHLPIVGDVELASAAAFDVGVFLMVIGGVMLALANFSNLGRMTATEEVNETPMDYVAPSKDQ